MSSYEYTDPAGDTITISPTTLRGGFPAIDITIEEQGTGSVVVPLAMVEEVVAGLRDMARQAGGVAPTVAQPAAAFSVAERQFLTFALDLAADRMASRSDEFTDEDHATLDRFRSMSVGEASA